jgi:DNA-binding HxlR family transcriptional regulator
MSALTCQFASYEDSAVRFILDRIGDKWSFSIISQLANGAIRFGQLRLRIDDISQRMLAATLRNLLRDGLIERQVFPTTPPTVEYRLSPLGQSFLEPMRTLQQWAAAANEEVQAARAVYDATEIPRNRCSSGSCGASLDTGSHGKRSDLVVSLGLS